MRRRRPLTASCDRARHRLGRQRRSGTGRSLRSYEIGEHGRELGTLGGGGNGKRRRKKANKKRSHDGEWSHYDVQPVTEVWQRTRGAGLRERDRRQGPTWRQYPPRASSQRCRRRSRAPCSIIERLAHGDDHGREHPDRGDGERRRSRRRNDAEDTEHAGRGREADRAQKLRRRRRACRGSGIRRDADFEGHERPRRPRHQHQRADEQNAAEASRRRSPRAPMPAPKLDSRTTENACAVAAESASTSS